MARPVSAPPRELSLEGIGQNLRRRGRLEIRHEPGGLRHYLDGRAVAAGQRLELVLGHKVYPGRYEWFFDAQEPAMFFPDIFEELHGWERGCLLLPEKAELRWPTGRSNHSDRLRGDA